ncbi:MAG: DUF1122 family protein [Candidatus Binataceae bacterium]
MNLTESAGAMLARSLDLRVIGRFRLSLDGFRPIRARAGWFHIEMGLAGGDGRIGGPIMTAIVSGGGRGVRPWIECRFFPHIESEDGERLDLKAGRFEARLIKILGRLIPSGGHLMVDYESAGQERTFDELRLRVPPAATALGASMLQAGLTGEFKDWYFSEGGHEGPRKLQANKPPDAKSARTAVSNRIAELRRFKNQRLPRDKADAKIVAAAQKRAVKLIVQLKPSVNVKKRRSPPDVKSSGRNSRF